MAIKVIKRGRRKGSPTAWKERIRDAMLPGDSPHGVRSGTPAERRRDAIIGAKQLATMREKQRAQEALFPGVDESGKVPSDYLERNDGGMASKTRRF